MSHLSRILLVDAEPDVLEFMADLLRRQGHRVETATSGDEARSLARSQAFNVIVADGDMTSLSWEQLLRDFLDLQPHTPVILLTADGTSDLRNDMVIKRGAYDVITKPIED